MKNTICSSCLISSEALQTAPHLIDEAAFQSSMAWLRGLHQKFNGILTEDHTTTMSKDTKIAMTFCLPPSSSLSSSHKPSLLSSSSSSSSAAAAAVTTIPSTPTPAVPMMGELYEGVIYDIAENALENPYQVLLQQEKSSFLVK